MNSSMSDAVARDAVDYPDYALPVCDKVAAGEVERGILICGTGIGMSIAANKTHGIRCALAHDTFSAKATREHNDTNVLAMGETGHRSGLGAGNRAHMAGDAILQWRTSRQPHQEGYGRGRA